MSVIIFQSVCKAYDGRVAVQDLSLTIEDGERVVILGPSGCGKTTVLRLLAGFIAPDSGRILIDGRPVAADGHILVEPDQRNLGMVFQDLALWPHLSVKGNLEFGLRARGTPADERRRRVLEVLEMVRMQPYLKARPAALSGGQQQRVALARALVGRPEAVLMDEPLSSLDQELSVELRREILALHERLGFTLSYVTHNREEAFEIGERVIAMRGGSIAFVGSAAEARVHFESRPGSS